MNVSGIFNISKKTKNGKVYYYTSISKKNQDGSNESMLLPVRFTKGNETMLIMFPDDKDRQCLVQCRQGLALILYFNEGREETNINH